MLKKQINYLTIVSTGLFFFVLGVCFFTNRLEIWNWLYLTLVFGLLVMVGIRLLNIIINFKKIEHRFSQIMDMILWIILLIFAWANPVLFTNIFPRIIGCWILLHAISKCFVLNVKRRDHLKGILTSFIGLLFDVVMSFILLFDPNHYYTLISYAVGCYFMIYGGNLVLDFIREIVPNNSGTKIVKKIQLAIPPFLAALIPGRLMNLILNKKEEDVIKEEFEAIKKDIPIDLEVMVHLAPSGPAMFGHVDLIYRDIVISYGCYDPHHRKVNGTLGDGVVIVANRRDYLINCLKNENKILVGFGLNLVEHQKLLLDERIKQVFSSFVDFQSDEELKRKGLAYVGECDDYISRVTRNCENAHYYKIKKGKFHTFFVLYTNCVSFVGNLIECVGLNLVDLSGIISPGSYYDFLNKQFMSEKSFVIARKLYTKKDIKELEKDNDKHIKSE
ncbi:MAG: hypothetical protein RSC93_10685 [Erysipelotrichaceae bacterium]